MYKETIQCSAKKLTNRLYNDKRAYSVRVYALMNPEEIVVINSNINTIREMSDLYLLGGKRALVHLHSQTETFSSS